MKYYLLPIKINLLRIDFFLALIMCLWVNSLYCQHLSDLPQEWKWQIHADLPQPGLLNLKANFVDEPGGGYQRKDSLHSWWEVFGDVQLNQLVKLALLANPTLQASLARVEEAQAQVKVAASYLFPSFSLNPNFTRESLAPNRPVPFAVEVDRSWLNTFNLPLQYSYEADLWGRFRQAVHASRHQLWAEEAAVRVNQLLVTGEVARSFFLLRTLDQEINILQQTIMTREENLKLIQAHFAAGLVSEIDVMRAQTEKATISAQLLGLQRNRAEQENVLAIFCGQRPTDFSLPSDTGTIKLPVIAVDIPTILLDQRPDIAQARHVLAATKLQIKIARSMQWPRFNLFGSYGLLSSQLRTFPEMNSRTWVMGGGIALPLFEGRRNRANLDVAQAQYAQQQALNQQEELNVFREVETALAGLGYLRIQFASQQEASQIARQASVLSRERYQRGMVSYYEVIDAERIALEQERLTTQLRGQQLLYIVQLIIAKGGDL